MKREWTFLGGLSVHEYDDGRWFLQHSKDSPKIPIAKNVVEAIMHVGVMKAGALQAKATRQAEPNALGLSDLARATKNLAAVIWQVASKTMTHAERVLHDSAYQSAMLTLMEMAKGDAVVEPVPEAPVAHSIAATLGKVREELREAENRAEQWEKEAARYAEGEMFYKAIVVEVGKILGGEVYRSDDGSIQKDVLAVKVVEVLRKTLLEYTRLLREARTSHDEAKRTIDGLRADIQEAERVFGNASVFDGMTTLAQKAARCMNEIRRLRKIEEASKDLAEFVRNNPDPTKPT